MKADTLKKRVSTILVFTTYFFAILIGLINYNWKKYSSDLVPIYVVQKSEGRTFSHNKSIYRVIVDTQSVVYWYPGVSSPKRMKDCAIADKFNWQCTYSDNSGKVIMTNGVIEGKRLKQVGLIKYSYFHGGGNMSDNIIQFPLTILLEIWDL